MYRKIAKQLAQTTTDILKTIDFEEDEIMAEVELASAVSDLMVKAVDVDNFKHREAQRKEDMDYGEYESGLEAIYKEYKAAQDSVDPMEPVDPIEATEFTKEVVNSVLSGCKCSTNSLGDSDRDTF